jgi:O-methyltransferase
MRLAKDLVPAIDAMPSRKRETFPEIEDEVFWLFYDQCKDYSLVHVTGFYNVYQTFGYIATNDIRGNAVECGCFLGGVAAFMGLLRKVLDLPEMQIILFDTFEGPPIGSSDTMLGQPIDTPARLPNYRELVPETIEKVVGSVEGYSFVEGLVEDTLPVTPTGDLSLLRLDTDFYSSTKAELEILYPRLVRGGALIIDDYGLFQGARKATDEYFAACEKPPLLNRIDIGVWSGVKP